jgi:hypothetical protein
MRCDVPRKCIFDGGTPLTVEHAIPGWVHDYLPGEGVLRHARGSGHEWNNKVLAVTVARVCDPCNSGWMSRLEERAKPLLIEPIQQQRRIWTPREQRTVATWAFKTALMCGLASGHQHVPDDHFRQLRKTLHPPGSVRVWAAIHAVRAGADEFQIAGVQSRGIDLDGVRTGLKTKAYVLTLNIGHIAFQIFGHDSSTHLSVSPPAIGGITPDLYEIPIWPTQAGSVTWPPTHGFDLESLLVYSKRFELTTSSLR